MKNKLQSLLNISQEISVKKILMVKLGISPAFVLTDILKKAKNKKMVKFNFNSWHPIPIENEINFLCEAGIIKKIKKTKKDGVNEKNFWIKIQYKKLSEIFLEKNPPIPPFISDYSGGDTLYTINSIVSPHLFNNINDKVINANNTLLNKKRIPVLLKNKNNKKNISVKKSKYLEIWNKFPNVPKHKKPETKIYKKANVNIILLKKGLFSKNKVFSESLKKVTGKKVFTKKWKDTEIIKVFDSLNKLYTEGYWPRNKKHLPKNLPDLLYNPMSGFSCFFYYYINPPELLQSKVTSPFPEITEIFCNLITNKSEIKVKKLVINLNEIKTFYEEIITNEKVLYFFPSFYLFCKEFSVFLKQDWIKNINELTIKKGSPLWNIFIKKLQEEKNLIF